MKIALLIYGEFREFDTVVKSWDFLKKYDCDIYISTWDYSFQENKNLGYRRERFITKEMIQEILPDAKIIVSKESDYFKDYHWEHDLKKRTPKVVFHWKNCIKMMKESGVKYDLMILNRTDNYTIFDIELNHLKEMSKKKDRLYGLDYIYLSNPNTYHLVDLILFGNYDTMYNMIDKCPPDLDGIHHEFSLHIISCNIFVDVVELGVGEVSVGVFRPNSLEIGEDININKVVQRHIIWEQTRLKE